MEEKRGNSKVLLILVAIIVIIVGVLVYVFIFGSKVNKSSLQKLELTESNQSISLGKDEVTIKKEDDNLYINDQLMMLIDEDSKVLKTNELIFVLTKSQCLNSLTVFDKTGNKIGENYKYQIDSIKEENGKLVAEGNECPCLDEGACPDGRVKVELVYDGTKVTMNVLEKNIGQIERPLLEEISLTSNPQKVALDDAELAISFQDNVNLVVNDRTYLVGEKPLVYRAGNLLYVLIKSQCSYALTIYDKTGTVIEDNYKYQVDYLYEENGKIVATGEECPCLDEGACPDGRVKVELVSDGSKVTMNVLEKNIK